MHEKLHRGEKGKRDSMYVHLSPNFLSALKSCYIRFEDLASRPPAIIVSDDCQRVMH